MRYHVISHQITDHHLNCLNLLPASCALITGIIVRATMKQSAGLQEQKRELSFPQARISDLLTGKTLDSLFYSYLKTRSNEIESKQFFTNDLLPIFCKELSENILFEINEDAQKALSKRISELLKNEFISYLYSAKSLMQKASNLELSDFKAFVKRQVLQFLYQKRKQVFYYLNPSYLAQAPFDCGNISLLVNGNSFLLRDYTLTANNKAKSIKKEVIEFYEPLEINSSLQTVFKSNFKNKNTPLQVRIYIQYELEKHHQSLKP